MKHIQRMIKFRVWDQQEEQMFYPIGEDIEMFIECFNNEQTNNALMQFAGLKDKNEKDIYEGDIIECFNYNHIDFRHVVTYLRGAFGYYVDKHMFISFAENYNFNFKNGIYEEIKVVGNIYEDKDILIHG